MPQALCQGSTDLFQAGGVLTLIRKMGNILAVELVMNANDHSSQALRRTHFSCEL